MKPKSSRHGKLSVYSNLALRRKTKQDARARKKAEYLATLPKGPFRRTLHRLHPKRVLKFWFSRQGGLTLLKLGGIAMVILAIFVGALFAYYRRELDSIRPGEISKRVQTTVTKYYDRNDQLIWEDKGEGNYKLVVESQNIAQVMKQATIAIEDKDFYKHAGVSPSGLIRATVNNAKGGSTQGGSTLTQQLVKNVFFATESGDRTWSGLPRKIKEIILSVEVERMYNKDQILTLYLNEVPYGGRRSGVESGAQSYFGKSAKDLTLAEAALLASIPQQPTFYNPYVIEGHKALIARQHTVLDNMVEQGYVKQKDADAAKKIAILDTIRPEADGSQNSAAPHFVREVRDQLEQKYGQKLVRGGGLTIKTTLDIRAQDAANRAIQAGRQNFKTTYDEYGAPMIPNNMSLSSVDVETGQVVAMVGSVDYNDLGAGGENNFSVLTRQPGSSIKPFDYASLLKQRPGTNYGAGSLFVDDKRIQAIYCQGNPGDCSLENFGGRTFGTVTMREALANSLNTIAVQAMHLSGVKETIDTAREAGDLEYCKSEEAAGTGPTLSAAIGGGCQVSPIQHANAYATLARGGVYKPVSYILDVKNAQGDVLQQWKDESKPVMDPQIPYILSEILSDANARSRVFGTTARSFGFAVPGVKTASKTGTSDDSDGRALDNWMASYSPKVATTVWSGRSDGKPMGDGSDSSPVRRAVNDYMNDVHKLVYMPEGKYKENDWFPRPAGIQDLTVSGRKDIWPSWFKKPQDAEGIKMMFDKVSRKKAASCTPEKAKIELVVQSYEDPTSKKKVLSAPDGYDANADDDRHKCDDIKPFVSLQSQQIGNGKYRITATVNQGTFPLQQLDILVEGQVISSQGIGGAGKFTVEHSFSTSGAKTISANVTDQGFYEGGDTKQVNATVIKPGGATPPPPNIFP